MDILAETLVDILAEEKLVTCKNSMDILAEFFSHVTLILCKQSM